MKFIFLFSFVVISSDSNKWIEELVGFKYKIDNFAKLKYSKNRSCSTYNTYQYEKFIKKESISTCYGITDTFSRISYIKNKNVFCVHLWYTADYLSKGVKTDKNPKGEVTECLYWFKSKNEGVLLKRSLDYFEKIEIDSISLILVNNAFDTIAIDSKTCQRMTKN